MGSSSDLPKGGGDSVADETTPLLVASGATPAAQSNEESLVRGSRTDSEDDDKPLPKMQIALLCYARLVEPIAFFSIFPFINKMIWETGNLAEADVGFYTGLIVSGNIKCVLYLRQACLISTPGIPILIDSNVVDDTVGQGSRQVRKETNTCLLVGRSDVRHGLIWT
jgi:hypothetical protein